MRSLWVALPLVLTIAAAPVWAQEGSGVTTVVEDAATEGAADEVDPPTPGAASGALARVAVVRRRG